MLMKISNDITGNPAASFRLMVECHNNLRPGMINCPRGIKISFFLVQPNTTYPVHMAWH